MGGGPLSPELETLDQLLGGDLPLAVICGLFGDDARFAQGILAMLDAGDVRLLAADGVQVPRWQWPEVLGATPGETARAEARLAITQAGVRRIG